MITRQTRILLGIFAFMIGLVLYLQRSPLPGGGNATPSPTAPSAVLPGWQPADIVWIELKNGQDGTVVRMSQNGQGDWVKEGETVKVDPAVVDQVRSALTGLKIEGSLSGEYSLDALNLAAPLHILTVRTIQGKQAEIRIGAATPTGAGVYLQVDRQAPLVAGKSAVDGIVSQMTQQNELQEFIPGE